METLSLHILDIAENSIRAGAKKIEITITEDAKSDLLTVCIGDDGKGMDEETLKKAADPFYTTKTGKKTGLGISLLSQAASDAGGKLTLDSQQGRGTIITAVFKQSHPDMKPMGDIFKTMAVLIASRPEIRFLYTHIKDGEKRYFFDSHKNIE